MPELIEVEAYRRAAEPIIGRRITAVPVLDPVYLRQGVSDAQVRAAVTGRRVRDRGRIGKLMLVDTDGPMIGLRFGMTGRLLVDGGAAIDRLEYGGRRNDPAWDRLVLDFDRGELRIRDPRRFGALELDPDVDRLGPDAATLTVAQVRTALGSSFAPLKARLLDQARIAGLGNLLVDEILWRAGRDPHRTAGSLTDDEQRRLARTVRSTIAELTRRGGSHTGDLHQSRMVEGRCPLDGEALRREAVGGRTTYWCPVHQT